MTLDIPPDPEEESLDWLEGLQGDDEDIEGGDQENVFLPEEEEETPDWMKDDFGSEAAEENAEDEVPDWLGNIREAEGTDQESDTGASESSEEESSAWLENIREAEGTDQESDTGAFESSEEESSEWLENIQNLEGESPAAEAEDTGDFMDKIHEKIEEDTIDAGEESEAGGDWLSGLDPETSDEDIQADDSSDLMGGLEEDSQSEPFQEAASEAPAELPDWMQSQETPEADSGYDEQAPVWMETEKTEEDEGVDPPAFDTGEGAGLSSGFLEDTDTAASQVDVEFPGLPGEPGEGAAVMPSWLDDLEEKSPNLDMGGEIPEEYLPGAPAFVTETDDAPSEGIKTLPTFAKEDDTTPTPVRIPDSPEEEEINLARAELPDWLQAMRPEGEGLSEEPAAAGTAAAGTAAAGTAAEEAAVAAPIEHEITSGEENVGPLAGLSNVLPAEPDVVQFGTPSIYSGDLVVSPAQMDYASVLEKMVLSEDLPVQVKKRKLSLPQQLFRWIIAALLYIAILVPVLLGSQNVAMPLLVDMPEETRAVRDLVNSISPGIPVLIAFDYQPGLAGELTTAAAAVIDNLILKGAELVLISTKPTGPGLAEYFLQTTLNEHEYISQNKYSNLGFISGGTAALLNFGTNPRAAIALPLEDGTSGWDQAPLLGINSIQSFGMVIVITDDPDTARAWVEQVQPQMVDQSSGILSTPLVMVVSAQAEPLVYPYYQTSPKQISGMVTGLAGGAYYESGGTRQIIARSFWDGFSSGLTATILILAVGSFINLSRKLISSRSAILGRFRRS